MRAWHAMTLILTVAAVGACAVARPMPPPPVPPPVDHSHALQEVTHGSWSLEMPLRKAEDVIADGSLIVQNVDGEPVTIVEVEMAPAVQAGLAVVGRGVVVLGPRDSGFVTREFPPKLPASYRFQALDEVVLRPSAQGSETYEIFIGLRLESAATVMITGLNVTYIVAGRAYSQTFDHHLTLCLGPAAGATSCA
jgi:hypothetical protein